VANPLRGEATFKAGDREYTLVFDINAFCEIEADTGHDLPGLIDSFRSSPTLTLVRAMVCAGLQDKHPGITKTETGRIMSEDIEAVNAALEMAFQAAMPEAKEGSQNPPNRRQRRAAKA
jgi:hypothetical protein